MAQPWNCDNGDGTPAFLVMTQPESGDVTALCGPCLGEWAEQLLIAADLMTGIVEKHIAQTMAAAEAATEKPKRARKGAAATPADPPQDTAAGGESTVEGDAQPQE